MNPRIPWNAENFWLSEELLAFQEGLGCKELNYTYSSHPYKIYQNLACNRRHIVRYIITEIFFIYS